MSHVEYLVSNYVNFANGERLIRIEVKLCKRNNGKHCKLITFNPHTSAFDILYISLSLKVFFNVFGVDSTNTLRIVFAVTGLLLIPFIVHLQLRKQ